MTPLNDELAWMDGVGLADLVRTGQVTPTELVEAAIARAEATNPQVGFLVEPMYDLSRRAARVAAATEATTLPGVPMLLKDHLATHAGVRHTSGSRFLRGYHAPVDSELVARYKRGGLIPIGTTAASEFALLSTGESTANGPCRNPWDLTRSTGGSSGGSAAAVAAGVVPIAHGNDAGGSIRIPAGACGLFGLKPTRGRNPLGPDYGDISSGLWAEHVLTRSVRDSAAALDISAGPMPGDPYAAPPAPGSYAAQVGAPSGRFRIGYSRSALAGEVISSDCESAVEDAAALCLSLGHIVDEAELPIDGYALERAYSVLYAAGAAWRIDAWARVVGRQPDPSELEPYTRALADRGRRSTAADYLIALQDVQTAARHIAAFHDTFDLFLTPTTASAAVPLDHFAAPEHDPLQPLHVDAAYAPFTWIANATGQPAMSVPLYWNSHDLPIGSHFSAAFGREDLLLRLASQLEDARPWSHRRPPHA